MDKDLKLTEEQRDIINCFDGDIAIEALAGTAKTTTLVEYAKAYPNKKFLYACFNKSIQEEADKKFPSNTIVKTINSIAHNHFFYEAGFDKKKFVPFIRKQKIIEIFGVTGNRNNLRIAIKYVEHWFSLTTDGLPLNKENILPFCENSKHINLNIVLDLCNKIIQDRFSKDSLLGYDHNTYLKYFQVNKIELSGFDYILFDESQDSNPIMTEIIYNQPFYKIFVGDNHQAIYQFRGAKNELNKFVNNCKNVFKLTQNFRFGNNLAELVSKYLNKYKGENKILKGLHDEEVQIFSTSSYLNSETYKELNHLIQNSKISITKIYRTNGMFFYDVNKLLEEPQEIFFTVNGDIKKYKFDICLDIYYLKKREFSKIKGDIKKYKSFSELKNAIKDDDVDDDIVSIYNFVIHHDDLNMEEFIKEVEDKHKNGATQKNKITFSTAHVSKGLEWDIVILSDDFLTHSRTKALKGKAGIILKSRLEKLRNSYLSGTMNDDDKDIYESEINLLYVALTRAKKILIIPDQLYELLI